MKSLFNLSDNRDIRNGIDSLTPQSQKQWGKMDIAQMMAHCSNGFEGVIEKLPFKNKSNVIRRVVVKRLVLKAVHKGDLGKNVKTFPKFQIIDQRDFETEKNRLLRTADAIYDYGIHAPIGRHPYFGSFKKDAWRAIQYLHTHHHLKQFSV